MFGQLVSDETYVSGSLTELELKAASELYLVEVTTEAERNTTLLIKR